MRISVIIPTYRESKSIQRLIEYVQRFAQNGVAEIIVADAGSDDKTVEIAQQAGALTVISPLKGRAAQMNYGASFATGDILYFVHADVLPPATFAQDIRRALAEGYEIGRYYMKFDSNKWYLKINAFFTRFDFFVCYGGDQTLFVDKRLFEKAGGFKSDMLIMEDFEFTKRARKIGRYKILKKGALISARKYSHNSWWQVQKANNKIVTMYRHGASQKEMVETYKQMLKFE
ncbi:MAG: TIGR04283 family arsenosugar biosynthesis glycosyltransferase [Chitinophagaceae bacterium]|nr:TIGR04283 family arsenosugar biosynthesis glycosyltransferase [Chitinophagaceae bacterium]